MREKLRDARRNARMTQQQMADELHISLSHYKAIEYGEHTGAIKVWDKLEDITGIHQRTLRVNTDYAVISKK